MERPTIVSHAEWLAARKEHLAREKELTRLRDQVSAERRRLPWVKVDKSYTFEGKNGKETLADLFDGRSQLIVYHFMFDPSWKDGCRGCSFVSDHIDGTLPHLAHRDVTLVVISRAPSAQLEAFKQRMGWRFKWVSSGKNDFNFDYHVSFGDEEKTKGTVVYNFRTAPFALPDLPGVSVFYKDERGDIYHTYSAYARGIDLLLGTYNYLDLVPKGRDEDSLAFSMAWVRHHDRYAQDYVVDPTAGYVVPEMIECGCESGMT